MTFEEQNHNEMSVQEVVVLRRRVIELENELARYQEARDQLATFPEQNPNIVIETDFQGNVTYVNPVGAERFPDLWALGPHHPLLIDLPSAIEQLQHDEVDFVEREVDIGFAVFEQKICYTSGVNIRLRIFNHDLTRRKRAEEALQESEAQNRALLNAQPDLILQLNRQGYFVACRPGGNILFNCDHFLDKCIFDVLPHKLAQEVMAYAEMALQEGGIQLFEHRLPFLQGVRDYEIRMVVSGEEEVLLIVRDITERKRAEQLAMRTERLAMLGLLSAVLAHEVNNPLQILQSHLDLLLDFPLEEAEKEAYRQVIRSQIERLTQLTSRILNYSRQRTIPTQLVSVPELVQHTLALVERPLEKRGIRVTMEFQQIPPVRAIPNQLDQVFLNLIINAGEAAMDGGWIHLAALAEDGNILVTITNNGKPIASSILPRIFDAFVTSKPEGSGLGLWLTHKIVEQHKGRITAENLADGSGVRFTVRLPAASVPEGE